MTIAIWWGAQKWRWQDWQNAAPTFFSPDTFTLAIREIQRRVTTFEAILRWWCRLVPQPQRAAGAKRTRLMFCTWRTLRSAWSALAGIRQIYRLRLRAKNAFSIARKVGSDFEKRLQTF